MVTFKDCFFLGQEAEGEDKGVLTLFVSGRNHTLSDVSDKLMQNHVTRIYFGAGEVYGLPEDASIHVEEWKGLVSQYTCLVEIDSDELFCQIPQELIVLGLQVVWVIKTKQKKNTYNPSVSAFKLINEEENYLEYIHTRKSKTNSVDDILYFTDRKI